MGSRGSANEGFEGATGRVAGLVMARLNRDMERAAVDALQPDPAATVLSIGFGPGVGLAELLHRLPDGRAAGIDPSPTMVTQARQRNRSALESDRLVLAEAAAEAIPWPDRSFDGVLAVNSIQLWSPLATGVAEVACVTRPGGVFVALTHVWAIEKSGPLAEWTDASSSLLAQVGMGPVAVRTDRYRSGAGVLLRAELLRPCNRNAPESPEQAG
jgi:ubiquinone/menaquinone biosynthesis C-methylase UbiE